MCLAIPGKIVELVAGSPLGMVEVAGVRRRVDLSLIEEERPAPGDWVLIHVGFAMSRISEADALEQMRILAVLGEAAAALEEVRGYDSGSDAERSTGDPSPTSVNAPAGGERP